MSKPKYLGVNELREMYLKFFESKNHLRLPSFSLIPQDDASLLLINSGMAPMKPYFTGEKEPPRHRVTTCQKCIRTGDIENIGHTARHGTYFEMLGNFSFGDYFKREAIHWAWEFLTSPEWVGIDPSRLYPSVFAGNETTPADEEAFRIWNEEIGIPTERIFKFGKEDNFWEHGSGPCGPCSEIYYDRGEKYGCGKPGCTVGCDCDRYMEVWNIVFSQFNNDGEGHYEELKQKNIDTGMGLERLAVVCQDVDSLFDVDTVMNITHKVSEITHAHYGESHERDVSLRVITDHIRSATFMICDGVLPSNEGRGYVLRRLLRRAARHGKLLGVNEPFLYEVCATVIHENEGHYPELRERQDYITKVIRVEEENFARTIDGGLKIFHDMLQAHKAKMENLFSGADAFKLYDTYGFPIDLTIEMVAEHGMKVAQDAFKALMEEQKVRARKAREALGDLGWAGVEFGKEVPETTFTGYTETISTAKVVAIVAEGELVDEIVSGVEAIVVLDKTPFYAEMGGQVADHGSITGKGLSFQVADVQKNKGGKYMHYGKMVEGVLKVGDPVEAAIDVDRRKAVMRAHTATHLLDTALRQVLGAHVQQAGSLVEPDRLRFDFTHFSAMTPEELARVAAIVNEAILEGYEVHTDVLPIEEAKQKGAIALFGEKYGDTVRVVDMGHGFSVEFCGGTHLDNTAKAGFFHIDSEFSVASGVRRIEATTGLLTLETLNRNQEMLFQAAAVLKAKPFELRERVSQTMEEIKALRHTVEAFQAKEAVSEAKTFLMGAKDVGDLKVLTATLPDADADKLRKTGDFLRDRDESVVAVLSSVKAGKITFLAVCGKAAVAKGIKAGDIIRSVTAICGGKGGGKPDSAMGGGSDLLKLDDALATVDGFVAEKLGL
ncbi:alanine--tRNA ligase [Vermiculatibacterium agrestimuris]|uniref:alanine--tRNA ligase n=1 Tax=Vermiculatibacterium agrestimuris TaxID=2941519 RepID=UPI00203B28F7|nr:alanine--tRNA ligase [Vermiculatibacterium agrestimuris]